MKNQVQLITYIDRLSGGGIEDLGVLLQGPLQGLFAGLHLLPFFDPIDGADAGFDPIDHTLVDARLGSWQDIRTLAAGVDLMADLIVNHISRQSRQCQDYLTLGSASAWAGLLLTRDSVFAGDSGTADMQGIYRPRPGPPFSETLLGSGEKVALWTTFTPEQIDIDVFHPLGQGYLDTILQTFAANGITMVRLDAIGYTVKKAGTSCFMLPETFAYIDTLTARVHELGMEALVEIHAHYQQQIDIAQRVDWVYDFALPPLVLNTFLRKDLLPLKHWLSIRPENALNVLDTHDGIGVIDIGAAGPDRPGLVSPEALDALVEAIHHNCGDSSRLATGSAASNLDLYQINCTYYDAIGRHDLHYLLARAIQFFIPGIPQVYYVGLLAGENDVALLARTNVGRDINRHYYQQDEVLSALQRPVVSSLCQLIRLRNSHPAFQGTFSLPETLNTSLTLRWDKGNDFAELSIHLDSDDYQLLVSDGDNVRPIDLLTWTEN